MKFYDFSSKCAQLELEAGDLEGAVDTLQQQAGAVQADKEKLRDSLETRVR